MHTSMNSMESMESMDYTVAGVDIAITFCNNLINKIPFCHDSGVSG